MRYPNSFSVNAHPDDIAQSGSSAIGVAWDLGASLFKAIDDPDIDVALAQGEQAVAEFEQHYRNAINVPGGPDASLLLAALKDSETLHTGLYRIHGFAALSYASDTSQDGNRVLLQRIEERMTHLRNQLLFFDLEWIALSEADAERLINDPALADYKHYLQSERKSKPHTLSEAEEKIINDKNLTGIQAWQKMHSELLASARYKVELNGQTRELNQSEVLSLMRDSDRTVRQKAWEGFYGKLQENSSVLSFVYDTRFQDHLVSNRLRHYEHPAAARHLSNETDSETVGAMMSVIERNYPLAHRYFKLKAKLLKLDQLELYDQYAPLFDVKEKMTFQESRLAIVSSMQRFSPKFAEIVQRFYDERWIDAEPRKGKRGGAFCSGTAPKYNPFILCNYTDDLRDAMTMAHELGHGIHYYLSRKQSLFNYHPTLPVAETASVFAEMLLFQDLLRRMDTPQKRLALLCSKIEESFATVFRQNVLTRFEEKAYSARVERRLSGEQIGKLWLEANAPYYGDAIHQTSGYEWGWSYIPHFINTPFYCYAYSFGELLVLALVGKYRREGEAFVPKYTALLESGGSLSPREQMKIVGVDITDPAFWQIGFDELDWLVTEAEALAAGD